MDVNSGNKLSENSFFGPEEKFRFDCHGDLPCFGQCCRDINIFLTPYDVYRLKKKLGLSSAQFLKEHTVEIGPPMVIFPVVYLKMNEEDLLQCPFVTAKGCSVYDVRPWSCRMAPVDIAGPGSYKFAFDSKKCQGLNESREWTVTEWMQSQEMAPYEDIEASFKNIPMLVRFTGDAALDGVIRSLFRMVCYDTDAFIDFINKNKFLIKEAGFDREVFLKSLRDDNHMLKSAVYWFINAAGNSGMLKKIANLLPNSR
ncbi:MAG: hypothetical protein JL50_00280 [Peptococcaceae bacterium BICA1-7]|nr:MAG: hypothetical protein JL50_00280 [Peptococcaceae bacterium BICA1-7]HBV98178.1 YkgJ family cysteine cluster protein [Desulfotomaculum sp.]